MPSNVEKFSDFAAKVLDRLYDSFPLQIPLQDSDFLPPDDFPQRVHDLDHEAVQPALTKHKEWLNDRDIFAGTVRFLIDEGFIRFNPEVSGDRTFGGCQLTAKGLTHLHVEFKDKKLGSESATLIRWIKDRVASSGTTEGAVVVSLVTRFLQ
jgi:hypothetical protein